MTREEAINNLKKVLGFSPTYDEAFYTLFPEFKEESEDERIRKALINIVKGACGKYGIKYRGDEITEKMLLTYLEKQKEQKPMEWKPQPESLEALMYAIEGKWEMIKPTSYLSRRLKGLYEGLVNTFNVDEAYLNELPKAASAEDIEGLHALKQKIVASMERDATEKQDYSGLTDLERAIHRGFLCAGVENVPVAILKETARDCLAQIKPAEWSEEDEAMLKEIISFFKDGSVKLQHDLDLYAGFLEKRLKSLRPSWTLSEEQTNCLMKVITWLTEAGNMVDSGILADLKKQLETR